MNEEHNTNCDWFKDRIFEYMSGNLNEETNQKIENHLKHCVNCRTMFEENENDYMMRTPNTVNFRKLKNRFIGKVVSIVAISLISFFLLFFVFMPLLFSAVYHNRNEVASRVFADFVIFTIPSAQIKSFGSNQDFIDLKLNCKYSQNPFLSPKEINLTIPNFFGKINTSGDGYSSEIFFYEQATDYNRYNLTWNKLEKIGDISVCQAVIYFSSPITIEELDNFITGIKANNRYAWFVIDTGNIELYPKIGSNWCWGFPRYMQTVTEAKAGVTDDSLLMVAQEFQTEMQFLEKEGKYLGEKNLLEEIKAVNAYIDDNGIKVKGIVILARTQDILKYRDSKLISDIKVVDAELDYQENIW